MNLKIFLVQLTNGGGAILHFEGPGDPGHHPIKVSGDYLKLHQPLSGLDYVECPLHPGLKPG